MNPSCSIISCATQPAITAGPLDVLAREGFICRGQCGSGWPGWLLMEVNLADSLTFLSYVAFALFFLRYLRRRHIRMLRPVFTLLGLFFITCAMSHGFPV